MVEIEELDELRFEELLQILRKRAQWLIKIGKPMWNLLWLEKEEFIKKYKNPKCFIVKSHGENIGGFILIERDDAFWKGFSQDDVYYLHKLVVDENYSGKGYAKHIIRNVFNICKENRKTKLRINYYDDREYLKGLYKDSGFEIVDTLTMPDGVKITMCEKDIM